MRSRSGRFKREVVTEDSSYFPRSGGKAVCARDCACVTEPLENQKMGELDEFHKTRGMKRLEPFFL